MQPYDRLTSGQDYWVQEGLKVDLAVAPLSGYLYILNESHTVSKHVWESGFLKRLENCDLGTTALS